VKAVALPFLLAVLNINVQREAFEKFKMSCFGSNKKPSKIDWEALKHQFLEVKVDDFRFEMDES
jgi:hypothetical protein